MIPQSNILLYVTLVLYIIGYKINRNQNCKCITRVEWKNYFEQLFNADIVMDQGFHAHVDEYLLEHDNDCNECRNNSSVPEDFVNKDISLHEVEVAIDELNVQKSP